MKRIVFFLTGLTATAAVVWFLSTSRAAAQTDRGDTNDALYQQQAENVKRYTERLHTQEQLHQRTEALFEKQEQFMARQEKNLARFEKILDTWESQQKQYQKYLDSLKK